MEGSCARLDHVLMIHLLNVLLHIRVGHLASLLEIRSFRVPSSDRQLIAKGEKCTLPYLQVPCLDLSYKLHALPHSHALLNSNVLKPPHRSLSAVSMIDLLSSHTSGIRNDKICPDEQ